MKDIKLLTEERSSTYGHPIDQFNTTGRMFEVWKQQRNRGKSLPNDLENVLNHIAFMVIDKLVRLAYDPYVQDGYDDIQGYSSLWEKCLVEHERRENENSTVE